MNDVPTGIASPETRFLDALRAGRLEVQVCRNCAEPFFFPRTHCPLCHSPEYTWQAMRTGATLYSYSDIPASAQAAARNVVLVDMDDGFRMISTVVDGSELRIGMRLTARPDPQSSRIVFTREPS